MLILAVSDAVWVALLVIALIVLLVVIATLGQFQIGRAHV